jgi:tRNA threonylcarbamoyladenosine biosynthesis protein TsaB
VGAGEPLLLALETATRTTSVALLRGETLVDEEVAPAGPTTAEVVLPTLDALLTRCETETSALDAIAVSIGPGSFTSLRVGIATVKGLAFRGGRRVVAVPTLAALARSVAGATSPVVALLDARRGEVYAAAYPVNGAPGEACDWLPEGVYTGDELAAVLPAACSLVGEGVAICGDALRERLGDRVSLHGPPQAEPRARHVGELGVSLWRAGAAVAADSLVPRYVGRAEAEVRRTGVRFERGLGPA